MNHNTLRRDAMPMLTSSSRPPINTIQYRKPRILLSQNSTPDGGDGHPANDITYPAQKVMLLA